MLEALSYRCWGARGAGGEINSCFCCCYIVIISRIMRLSCCQSSSLCSLWNWKSISSLLRFSSISFLWREACDSAKDLIQAASWLNLGSANEQFNYKLLLIFCTWTGGRRLIFPAVRKVATLHFYRENCFFHFHKQISRLLALSLSLKICYNWPKNFGICLLFESLFL